MDEGIKTSQRVSRSCVECGRRKIKCDKRIPCKPCVRRNLAHECQRPITRVRGQLTVAGSNDEASPNEQSSVDELIKERCALQAKIAQLETALALSRPSAQSQAAKADDPISSSEIIPALEQFDLGITPDAVGKHLSAKDVADQLYEPASDPLFLLLPSKETSHLLVAYSLHTLGWLHCAVNAPALMLEHEEFWGKVHMGIALDRACRSWLALYFALLATGLLYLDPEELPVLSDLPQLGLGQDASQLEMAVQTSRIWYETALKEVERHGCAGTPSLHIVQALSVLTLCQANFGEHQREFLLTGFTTNMARCLDMHRLGSELNYPKNLSSQPEWTTAEQRELGRRVWWTYVIRDWLGSWSRSPSISPASFSCQFATDNTINHNVILEPVTDPPCPSPLLYQTIMSRLSYIFYIYIKVNAQQTISKCTKAMEEIETVKRNLPLHLSSRFPANIDDEEWESEHPWVPFQRYLITHSIEFMQLSIARALAMGKSGPESDTHRSTAVRYATKILQSYLSPVPRVYKLVWFVSASTVGAAIFVSLDILMNPHQYPPDRRHELTSLLEQIACELNKYSVVAIHASKGSASIQRLLSCLSQKTSMSHLSVHDILRHLKNQELSPNIDHASISNPNDASHLDTPDSWNDVWNGDTSMLHLSEDTLQDLLGPLETWDAMMDFSLHGRAT